MESNKLIEAMAEAICDGMGLREWGDVPADRGDLRMRVRSGENYDVNEPNRMDYLDGATAALKALRDTLEPVGYLHTHPDQPLEIEFFRLTNHDKVSGWTETPLYALPEMKP